MPISERQIKNAIHSGISTANRKYEKWSKGCWVTDSGVEGLMTAEIAEAINKKQSKGESLQMELAFKYIDEFSTANNVSGSKPKALNKKNRSDIVLFDVDYRPTCVIEVKRSWVSDACRTDLQRICALIDRYSSRRKGTLERGYLAMLIVKKKMRYKTEVERIDEHIEKIKKLVKSEFSNNTRRVSFQRGDPDRLPPRYQQNDEDWQAASFLIQISNRSQQR